MPHVVKAVGVQDSVEVVEFVLEDAGEPTLGAHLERFLCKINRTEDSGEGATKCKALAGDR